MRRNLCYSLMLIAALSLTACDSHQDIKEEKTSTNKINYDFYVMNSPLMKKIQIQNKQKEETHTKVAEIETRPNIKNVNLDENLLDYIWWKSQESSFSYEFILALIKVESDMGKDMIHRNNNGTVDKGLLQLNSRNIKWFAELANIKNPNPMNNFHNIEMGVAYLKEEREYWRAQHLSEEEIFYATTLSFNRGRSGAKDYIQKYGFGNSYLNKVLKIKNEYELNE